MRLVFHKNFYEVYTSDPAAAAGRMEAVMNVVGPRVEVIEAVPATETDIAAVHSGSHVDHVRRRGLFDIAALAAGGAIQAATLGLEAPAFGLVRPPGHHASSGSSWGFCYFNNMAVALEHLRRAGKIRSAYVLDIDLHFGDGTVDILGHKDYVTVYNCRSGSRDAYIQEVADEMSRCRVDMIGISAGFDNHEQDWGRTLSTDDYREIGRLVRVAAQRSGGGCFALLEGGYNHQVLGHNVLALIQGLSGDAS